MFLALVLFQVAHKVLVSFSLPSFFDQISASGSHYVPLKTCHPTVWGLACKDFLRMIQGRTQFAP